MKTKKQFSNLEFFKTLDMLSHRVTDALDSIQNACIRKIKPPRYAHDKAVTCADMILELLDIPVLKDEPFHPVLIEVAHACALISGPIEIGMKTGRPIDSWLPGEAIDRWLFAVRELNKVMEEYVPPLLRERANGERGENSGKAEERAKPGNAKMSPKDLAAKYGVKADALRKRLHRWRYEHDAGYSQVANPKKNEPSYLYDESAIMPVIEALKAKSEGRKRATDGQRKKV